LDSLVTPGLPAETRRQTSERRRPIGKRRRRFEPLYRRTVMKRFRRQLPVPHAGLWDRQSSLCPPFSVCRKAILQGQCGRALLDCGHQFRPSVLTYCPATSSKLLHVFPAGGQNRAAGLSHRSNTRPASQLPDLGQRQHQLPDGVAPREIEGP
jgi:hypothetical protein